MKRILIVIDYQKDFVDGALGFEGAEELDGLIAAKIREYGRGNVFFTRDTHDENYLETREGRGLPVPHCIKGSPGWQLYGETAKALEEIGAAGFDKRSFGLNIEKEARGLLPESVCEIELAGLVSNICVISNAVVFQTYYPEAQITVDAALISGADKKLHTKALDILEGLQVCVKNRDRRIG